MRALTAAALALSLAAGAVPAAPAHAGAVTSIRELPIGLELRTDSGDLIVERVETLGRRGDF